MSDSSFNLRRGGNPTWDDPGDVVQDTPAAPALPLCTPQANPLPLLQHSSTWYVNPAPGWQHAQARGDRSHCSVLSRCLSSNSDTAQALPAVIASSLSIYSCLQALEMQQSCHLAILNFLHAPHLRLGCTSSIFSGLRYSCSPSTSECRPASRSPGTDLPNRFRRVAVVALPI